MKNGIPSIWWTFRYAWTTVHLVLVAVLGIWLAVWLLDAGRGAQMFDDGYAWVQNLSDQLASAVPFPWD